VVVQPPKPPRRLLRRNREHFQTIMKKDEVPVRLAECRRIFGDRGRTWMSAIKRAMGVKGNYILVSQVTKFLRDNPGWTEAEIYRRTAKPQWEVVTRSSSGAVRIHKIRATAITFKGGGVSGNMEIQFGEPVVDVRQIK